MKAKMIPQKDVLNYLRWRKKVLQYIKKLPEDSQLRSNCTPERIKIEITIIDSLAYYVKHYESE